MGIYKDVNPVYGQNGKGERVFQGIKVDGKFYEGIRKTSEIQTVKPKPMIKKQAPTQTKKKLFGRS